MRVQTTLERLQWCSIDSGDICRGVSLINFPDDMLSGVQDIFSWKVSHTLPSRSLLTGNTPQKQKKRLFPFLFQCPSSTLYWILSIGQSRINIEILFNIGKRKYVWLVKSHHWMHFHDMKLIMNALLHDLLIKWINKVLILTRMLKETEI